MFRDREVAISRRAILQMAAVGGAATLVLRPETAYGVPQAMSLEENPGDIDAYLASTSFKGFTDLGEVHAEYREAAAKFPFALPPGWSFPAESNLRDQVPNEVWERGSGVAEVYMYWQGAYASAAYEAHLKGDTHAVEGFLDTIVAGYNTDVRRAILQDEDDLFIEVAVGGARRNNFEVLKATALA